MSIVAEVTLALIAVVVLIGLVVGLRSIPDVRRYLKIRNM
jgi:hypothetical protein